MKGRRKSHRGEPFQQLDGEAGQSWIVFVVNVFGEDDDEVAAVTAVLRQRLLQRGHGVGRRLQADHIVRDGESQLDRLDQDLTWTLRATAARGHKISHQFSGKTANKHQIKEQKQAN